jgi:ABC-type glycerol-3-phosphate transport system substrate-binding protein
VRIKDPGMADWFPSVLEGAKLEGKQYGIPFELHPGRPTVVYYNKDLLASKGIAEPKDTWTFDEFAETSAKLTDKSKRIFGESFFPNNVHDFCAMARSFGGDAMSEDRTKFTFNSDPGSLKAARWQVDMKTKYDAVPGRQDLQGLTFYAGLYAFYPDSPNIIKTVSVSVADKFKWDAVVAPSGPGGLRGAWAFIAEYVLSAKTTHAQEAYDLALYMSSVEVMTKALLEQGHNPARKSLWLLPTAHPIWKKTYDWFSASKAKQFFPIPSNLLFDELADKFVNLAPALWYGEVDFAVGMKQIQEECQKIMDKPRP